ncbi:MAG: hypothetical protein QOH52_4714 [Pseudonocardiales bacterium]|nr:hypothetical protein [Pseudonocardiales bacterium]
MFTEACREAAGPDYATVSEMRRPFARLLAFALMLTAALALPMSASAQDLGTKIAPGTCVQPKPYPPSPNATIRSSSTTMKVAETIEASGIHYCPDEDVRLTIGGKFVGTAHTDAAGAFDPPVVVPGPAGSKQLCGVGASGLSTDRDCLTLVARAAGSSGLAGAGGNTGGGTAFTGVEVALLCAVALLLIAGGVAFATAGRGNKTVPQP